MSPNLRFEQAEAALSVTNGAFIELRGEISSAIARLTEPERALFFLSARDIWCAPSFRSKFEGLQT